MNEKINKFLLAGDKFILEMHLRQPAVLGKPGFIHSVCAPLVNQDLSIVFVHHLLKTKTKKIKKQEIQDIFINTN